MLTTNRDNKANGSVTLLFHNNHKVAQFHLTNISHDSVLLKDTVSCRDCISSVTNERPRSTGRMILTRKTQILGAYCTYVRTIILPVFCMDVKLGR